MPQTHLASPSRKRMDAAYKLAVPRGSLVLYGGTVIHRGDTNRGNRSRVVTRPNAEG